MCIVPMNQICMEPDCNQMATVCDMGMFYCNECYSKQSSKLYVKVTWTEMRLYEVPKDAPVNSSSDFEEYILQNNDKIIQMDSESYDFTIVDIEKTK